MAVSDDDSDNVSQRKAGSQAENAAVSLRNSFVCFPNQSVCLSRYDGKDVGRATERDHRHSVGNAIGRTPAKRAQQNCKHESCQYLHIFRPAVMLHGIREMTHSFCNQNTGYRNGPVVSMHAGKKGASAVRRMVGT